MKIKFKYDAPELSSDDEFFRFMYNREAELCEVGDWRNAQAIHWVRADLLGASQECIVRARNTDRDASMVAFATHDDYMRWARKEFDLPLGATKTPFERFVESQNYDSVIQINGIDYE
tara:strand:- start:6295 stop:6648 length:354 start_codon:yes stop_codon:yes gene_type:complete